MSLEENSSRHQNTDGKISLSRQGLFKKERGSRCPTRRPVILGLALLNAALLTVAVVIGVNCAKAKDHQIPFSDEVHLMVELNYYRNHSNYIRAKLKDQETLVKQRTNHLHLKLELKQKKNLIDGLLAGIESLQVEKTNLKNNQMYLEENCGRCPKGWIFLISSCYYISRRVTDLKKNWPNSRADCISQGSDLLIIDHLDEQMVLNENLASFVTISAESLRRNGFWIGLSYAERQETWNWVNNVTEVENLNWKGGHSSLSSHQNGSCAAYYVAATRESWQPVNCQNQKLSWICEMEPKR